MWRAARLTYRMHRFEVVSTVALMVVVGIGLVIIPGRLAGIGVPTECFVNEEDPACRSLLDAFSSIRSNEASWLLGVGAGLMPILVGLLLGGPIVARELEMRTTALSWAMTGDRRRWLLQRLLPMLAIVVIGLTILGVLETGLLRATDPLERLPRLDELGSQGPTFVARGLMAMGIALLVGAVLGRSLAAFIVAGATSLALVVVGAPILYLAVAQSGAVWRDVDPDSGLTPMIIEFNERYRDELGRIVDWEEVNEIPRREADPDEWIATHLTRQVRGLPYESFGALELAETIVALTLGGATMLLTFPVVTRKRPD